jgi:hypothetical protein
LDGELGGSRQVTFFHDLGMFRKTHLMEKLKKRQFPFAHGVVRTT